MNVCCKESLFLAILSFFIGMVCISYSAFSYDLSIPRSHPELNYFAGDDEPQTQITRTSNGFLINGQLPQPNAPNPATRRNLQTIRLANAIVDITDGSAYPSHWYSLPSGQEYVWAEPDLGAFNPRKNTKRLIRNLPEFKATGVQGITVSMQSACECNGNLLGFWDWFDYPTNPYGANGRRCFDDFYNGIPSIHAKFLTRLGSLIRAADDLGMVVIVTGFYWSNEQYVNNPLNGAPETAVRELTKWIVANSFTNVMLDISNEVDAHPEFWDNKILHIGNAAYLVGVIHDLTDGDGSNDVLHLSNYVPNFTFPQGQLMASTSQMYFKEHEWSNTNFMSGCALWSASGPSGLICNEKQKPDFILYHTNGAVPYILDDWLSGTGSFIGKNNIEAIYQRPILVNEDGGGNDWETPCAEYRLLNMKKADEYGMLLGAYIDYAHQTVHPSRWLPRGDLTLNLIFHAQDGCYNHTLLGEGCNLWDSQGGGVLTYEDIENDGYNWCENPPPGGHGIRPITGGNTVPLPPESMNLQMPTHIHTSQLTVQPDGNYHIPIEVTGGNVYAQSELRAQLMNPITMLPFGNLIDISFFLHVKSDQEVYISVPSQYLDNEDVHLLIYILAYVNGEVVYASWEDDTHLSGFAKHLHLYW